MHRAEEVIQERIHTDFCELRVGQWQGNQTAGRCQPVSGSSRVRHTIGVFIERDSFSKMHPFVFARLALNASDSVKAYHWYRLITHGL